MLFRSIGFDHDTKTAGGKANITLEMTDLLNNTIYLMNSSESTSVGWGSAPLRTTLNSTVYNYLPAEVRNVIKPVNKLTSAGNNSSTIK